MAKTAKDVFQGPERGAKWWKNKQILYNSQQGEILELIQDVQIAWEHALA